MHSFTPARSALSVCLFVGGYVATLAWAAIEPTTASQVFAAVSPSIVVVKAFDKSGHAIALGSGVVIAQGVVVSNCHVFESTKTASASVFYQTRRYPATLRYGDPAHDLCSFVVNDLTAPPVKMGSAAALKVGENVYAIGAPEGLDLTLSSGIVSSLRKVPGGVVIQTTAPISPGSSGGGLFDSEARLIGITAYYAKKGQQLNFALPAEWIRELPARGRKIRGLAALSGDTRAALQKGTHAWLSGDYTTALAILGPLAEDGNAGAQSILGVMYAGGYGVRQNYTQALYWLGKAAAQGDTKAQYILGDLYAQGEGVPRDYALAAYWWNKAATQGFAQAQYALGLMYDRGDGVRQDYTSARYWYGKAAEQGNTDAQFFLGSMYWLGEGVPENYVQAAKWFIVGKAEGDEKNAGVALPYLKHGMTPAQIAEAQRLANQWWEAHHAKQIQIEPDQQQKPEEAKKAAKQKTRPTYAKRSGSAEGLKQQAVIDEYINRIRNKIRRDVLIPPGMAGNPEAVFDVVLLPGGNVSSIKLIHSSGVKAYDDAVERAIRDSTPLPVPSNASLFNRFRNLTFRFRPRE